uniref:Uncharacterized protein n=1 Tax=Odontella aurita TaxID=265563 RepID=A0A7S4HR12_9STRA|mmetsp:Transcript_13899/g.40655  ORF Transcript_13899/g.40655 Transcript_13899/m.40655 type:complete len:263 (+) Transcript_13899:217-1005(+)
MGLGTTCRLAALFYSGVLLNQSCATVRAFVPGASISSFSTEPHNFVGGTHFPREVRSSLELRMSLKPAAIPLMDSGKALARSGELLIDATSVMGLYGGGLSSAGANIRNAGDCVAQAAASCRFKTAAELVCDELREGATCLIEGVDKMKLAVEEARADKDADLAKAIENASKPLSVSGVSLEAAGAGIMQRAPVAQIGENMYNCGETLGSLAVAIGELSSSSEALESCQRMKFASEKMMEAGDNLRGIKPEKKPKGKAWIKG